MCLFAISILISILEKGTVKFTSDKVFFLQRRNCKNPSSSDLIESVKRLFYPLRNGINRIQISRKKGVNESKEVTLKLQEFYI